MIYILLKLLKANGPQYLKKTEKVIRLLITHPFKRMSKKSLIISHVRLSVVEIDLLLV